MTTQADHKKLVRDNRGVSLEQRTLTDDNLLPNASELEKLKDIDPNIIDWILKRTELEQDSRIDFNKQRIVLATYDLKRNHRFNFTALIFGFLLFLVVIAVSTYFIVNQYPVQGTIFGGAGILGAIMFFVKASRAKQN